MHVLLGMLTHAPQRHGLVTCCIIGLQVAVIFVRNNRRVIYVADDCFDVPVFGVLFQILELEFPQI